MSQKEFIVQILPGAVVIQKKHGLPAAALIAQVCLETGYGQHISKDRNTGKNSKNLLNIKGTGPAGKVEVVTKEFINGHWINVVANFRAYNSFAESFEDYVKLILSASRYRAAREERDPVKYAQELQRAGYATDPEYVGKIAWIIDKFELEKLVKGVLSMDKPVEVNQEPAPWAKEAVQWVKQTGISDGTRPKDPVTREEAFTLLYRFAQVFHRYKLRP